MKSEQKEEEPVLKTGGNHTDNSNTTLATTNSPAHAQAQPLMVNLSKCQRRRLRMKQRLEANEDGGGSWVHDLSLIRKLFDD